MEAKAYLLMDFKYSVAAFGECWVKLIYVRMRKCCSISQISALHMKAFASPFAFLWPLNPLLS